MKRILAMVMACLMLAASAAAEELYTFAGVEWGTPEEECEAALEKATRVGFTAEINPEDGSIEYLYADPGYYTVMGIPIDADSEWMWPGIIVYCGGELNEVEIFGNAIPVGEPGSDPADWAGLAMAEEVFRKIDERYGENACVYVDGKGLFLVPEAEVPYLFRDLVALAMEEDWEGFIIGLAQGNVELMVRTVLPGMWDDCPEGYVEMWLFYRSEPWTFATYRRDMALAYAAPFPLLNGEPMGYVEIVP